MILDFVQSQMTEYRQLPAEQRREVWRDVSELSQHTNTQTAEYNAALLRAIQEFEMQRFEAAREYLPEYVPQHRIIYPANFPAGHVPYDTLIGNTRGNALARASVKIGAVLSVTYGIFYLAGWAAIPVIAGFAVLYSFSSRRAEEAEYSHEVENSGANSREHGGKTIIQNFNISGDGNTIIIKNEQNG